MNDTELRELLQDTPAPAMSIDTERVVQRGRQRVRNTRIKYAAGLTAAVVAIGAVVGVGVMRVGQSTTPADPSRTHVGSIYKGMDATAKRGQFTAPSMQDGSSASTPSHTYRVTTAGAIERITNGKAVALPRLGTLAGGGVVAMDDQQTVTVYPVPASADRANLVTADDWGCAVSSGGAVRASNGELYMTFVSSTLLPAQMVRAVIWQNASGSYDSSRGQGSSVTLHGTSVYVFPQLEVTGASISRHSTNIGARFTYSQKSVRADGFAATFGGAEPESWVTQALVPRTAHDTRISYPSGWTGKHNLQCKPLPGTDLQACLDTAEAATDKAQSADPTPTVHWIDASGKTHTAK